MTPTFDLLARRQHGLVTRAQALPVIGRHGITHRAKCGRFVRVARSVYRLEGSPRTWLQAARAATLAAPPGAVLSHRAAGRLWGLPHCKDAAVEVTVGTTRSHAIRAFRVHRSHVHPDMCTTAERVPVTSIERTIVDLAGVLGRWRLCDALDWAIQRGLTTAERVWLALARMGSQGRRGVRGLRTLLSDRMRPVRGTESPLEDRIVRWLRSGGGPAPVVQHPVEIDGRRYRLDIAWPDAMVAVEVDGFSVHGLRRSTFDADRERNNALMLAGWRMIHVTATTRKHALLDAVRRALAQITGRDRRAP